MAAEGDYDYFRNVSYLLAAGRKFNIPSKHVDAALRIGGVGLPSCRAQRQDLYTTINIRSGDWII